jgi:hypothetical protein
MLKSVSSLSTKKSFANFRWRNKSKFDLIEHLTTIANKEATTVEDFNPLLHKIIQDGQRKREKICTHNMEELLAKLPQPELEEVLTEIVPFIADKALEAHEYYESEDNLVEILTGSPSSVITLSRYEIVGLMALMFFGLYPQQSVPEMPRNQDFVFM